MRQLAGCDHASRADDLGNHSGCGLFVGAGGAVVLLGACAHPTQGGLLALGFSMPVIALLTDTTDGQPAADSGGVRWRAGRLALGRWNEDGGRQSDGRVGCSCATGAGVRSVA